MRVTHVAALGAAIISGTIIKLFTSMRLLIPAVFVSMLCLGVLVGVYVSDREGRMSSASNVSDTDFDEPPVHLTPPAPREHWDSAPEPERTERIARAFHFRAPIFVRPGKRWVKGVVRRGDFLPIRGRLATRANCRGSWYETDQGYVCSLQGFHVNESPSAPEQYPADRTRLMPYRYAMVAQREGILRFHRVPTPAELRESLEVLAAREDEPTARFPNVVHMEMVGDFFIALAEQEDEWQHTVRGKVVRTQDLTMLDTPTMVGERLEQGTVLPLAFVFGETRTVYRLGRDHVREAGVAMKHARFVVHRTHVRDGVAYVVNDEGLALRRDEVRVARMAAGPERIPRDRRWIHVDLAEQTLVAYEGVRPVYATLVSSGKEGYDTPKGVFQVREKHVSTTMRGDDPVEGAYEVEEVPYTLFYDGSYALHGAYWHNDFGAVRSHGCSNLAPADAHWLFEWTEPDLPPGWHGRRRAEGTWIWFTSGDAPYDEPEPEDAGEEGDA